MVIFQNKGSNRSYYTLEFFVGLNEYINKWKSRSTIKLWTLLRLS